MRTDSGSVDSITHVSNGFRVTASRDLRELPVGVGGADSDEDLGVPEGRYRLVVLARAHEAGRGGEIRKGNSRLLLLAAQAR